MTTAWVLAANVAIPELGGCTELMVGRFWTTSEYPQGDPRGWADQSDGLAWESVPTRFGAAGEAATAITVTAAAMHMSTSDLNETPLSIITDGQRVAVTSDAIIAARITKVWSGDRNEAVVRQLAPGTSAKVAPSGILSESVAEDLLSAKAQQPHLTDPRTAGETLLALLDTSIRTAVPDPAQPVAVLLSAGIDSSSVATLAAHAGRRVTCYSAGTPWGNEHEGAAELCRHLGVPHVTVELSLDDLLETAPVAIRWLGHATPEKVDIALIGTALLACGHLPEATVLTGYGSDLVNLGLPGSGAADDPHGELPGLVAGLQDARYSGELSAQFHRAASKTLVHPFWAPDVLRHCLSITPAAKLHRGREKGHLRAAIEHLVPPSVAWRKKVAIHHGGGLQAGLDQHFGGRQAKARYYQEKLAALVERSA